MKRRLSGGCCAAIVIMLAGCVSTGSSRADISSESVDHRIRGIKVAAETRDWGSVPLIVDRLEDEDQAVRFYAILALERITGERFGYDYARPSRERAEAIQEWRLYVKRGEHLSAAGRDAPAAPKPRDPDA